MLAAIVAGVAATLTWLAPDSNGQAADPDALLVAEIVAQQKVIAENQTKIDTTLAEIAEDLRVARIFSARGGGKTP